MEEPKDARSALRAWKAIAGISSSEVARRMGVTRSVVCRIEHNPECSMIRTLARYAEACGVRDPLVRIRTFKADEKK